MSSVKGLLLDAVKFALREAKVSGVREIGPSIRAIELTGDKLRGAGWIPGDKIQVVLPTKDVRTYTPTRWDGATTEILAFHRGTSERSPGSAWSRTAAIGDVVRFVGPQRSLKRAPGKTAVLFGDETSFGVASALAGGGELHAVLEVTSRADTEPVVAEIGATVTLVEKTGGDAHLASVADRLVALLAAHPEAELLMTGRAQSIQALRTRLRAAGVRPRDSAKPYWAVGKTGLD